MDQLLFLTHRIPFPPNKGDKIRSYHLLKQLAKIYRVHLATFVDDPNDWQYVPDVKNLCEQTYFARLNPNIARLRSARALLGSRPLSIDYYRNADLQAWVETLLRTESVKRIVVFSSTMAQFVPDDPGLLRIIDFVDVDSDKWSQYAQKKMWPMSWLYRREGKKLLELERQIAGCFDASLFVSEAEAALFKSLAPESQSNVSFFNNGVDLDYFCPDRSYTNPYAAEETPIVFTGAMDYWPNIDAVQWFAQQALPAIREKHPHAVFYIVGARPSSRVKELARLPGIKVTGTVPDVRPYLAHAQVVVAPLRIARGVQNKVLEAMAMAKSVVVTPQALEGIRAAPGCDLLVATNGNDFAAQVSALLLQDTLPTGPAARHFVQQQYTWEIGLARIRELLVSPSSLSSYCTAKAAGSTEKGMV